MVGLTAMNGQEYGRNSNPAQAIHSQKAGLSMSFSA